MVTKRFLPSNFLQFIFWLYVVLPSFWYKTMFGVAKCSWNLKFNFLLCIIYLQLTVVPLFYTVLILLALEWSYQDKQHSFWFLWWRIDWHCLPMQIHLFCNTLCPEWHSKHHLQCLYYMWIKERINNNALWLMWLLLRMLVCWFCWYKSFSKKIGIYLKNWPGSHFIMISTF